MSKIWNVLGVVLNIFFLLTQNKVVYIIMQIEVVDQNSISNYGLMSRAAQKTVMFIYGVMFTEYCDCTYTKYSYFDN